MREREREREREIMSIYYVKGKYAPLIFYCKNKTKQFNKTQFILFFSKCNYTWMMKEFCDPGKFNKNINNINNSNNNIGLVFLFCFVFLLMWTCVIQSFDNRKSRNYTISLSIRIFEVLLKCMQT